MQNFEISVLDLAPVKKDKTIHDTFQDSLSLANHAENLSYKRFWLAEHHNMESIASSATSVLIGFIANGTKKIRVGSGGIMLPNHSSLVTRQLIKDRAAHRAAQIAVGEGGAVQRTGAHSRYKRRCIAAVDNKGRQCGQQAHYDARANVHQEPPVAVRPHRHEQRPVRRHKAAVGGGAQARLRCPRVGPAQ